MFWVFMVILFIALVDFKLLLGLFRIGGFFVVGLMIGTYLFASSLQWLAS